ncbi:MAG: DMT family transporter, partial [bacterium]
MAAAAAWGVATVISKRAVTEIPPLALLPIQLSTSVAVIGVVMRVRGDRLSWTGDTARLGLLGFLNPGLSYALGLIGLTQITASLSVVLWATEPLMILLLAAWFLRESITTPMAGALGAATIGVGLVVLESGTAGTLPGIALTLAGVAACAIYTVVVRRWMGDDSTLAVLTAQQICALLFSLTVLGLVFVSGNGPDLSGWSSTGWISAAVSGLLYYAIAFWFYLTALRRI